MQVNKPSELKRLAMEVLGQPYYDDLAVFFQNVFSHDGRIAFVTRRCSCLGYLFAQILLNDIERQELYVKCLTDSALIDSGYYIGTQLPNGQSPEILLVDDSIAYGRAVRSILENFLDRISEGFHSVNGDERSLEYLSPLKYIQSRVEVLAFSQKQQQFVLPSFYHRQVHCCKNYCNTEWNELSNRFSELVNVSNVANTAFILSGGTTDEPKELLSNDWIHTQSTYYGLEQHVWLKTVFVSGQPAAICSVRRIQCDMPEASGPYYRYIPFVFLPSLNIEHLNLIADVLDCSMQAVSDSDQIHKDLEKLLTNATPRKRMELLSLCLSQSVLHSFADDFGIALDDFDTSKIAWNYASIEDKTGVAVRFLLALSRGNGLMSHNTLLCKLSEISPLVLPNSIILEPCSDPVQSIAQESLELQLFRLHAEAESCAYNSIVQWDLGEVTLNSLNEMRCESFFAFVESLQKVKSTVSTIDWFTCILQMMDCGAMSIVIAVEAECVVQQIRVCEQAPFLLLRRYSYYMDVLRKLDQYRSYPLKLKCAQVEQFDLYLKERGYPECTQILCSILSLLKESPQTVEDFDIRFHRHFVIDKTTFQAQWDYAFEKRQKNERLIYAQLWRDSKRS